MHARYTALLSKQVIIEAVKQVKEEKQGRRNGKIMLVCKRMKVIEEVEGEKIIKREEEKKLRGKK